MENKLFAFVFILQRDYRSVGIYLQLKALDVLIVNHAALSRNEGRSHVMYFFA